MKKLSSKNLKRYRKIKGMLATAGVSLSQISVDSGKSPTLVTLTLQGQRRNHDVMNAVAHVFNVSVEDLFND